MFQVEPLFCEWIRKNIKDWQDCVVVAPDEGSVKRCTSVANDLNLDFALITNRKPKDKKSQRKRDHKSSTSIHNSRHQSVESAYTSRQQSIEPEDSHSEGGASTKGSESDAGPSGLQVLGS